MNVSLGIIIRESNLQLVPDLLMTNEEEKDAMRSDTERDMI